MGRSVEEASLWSVYMGDLLFEDESYANRGACFEVYKEKGCGFLEPVYQECLAIQFELSSIPFIAKPNLLLEYKGRRLVLTYQPDFVCFEKIILELKAVRELCDEHRAQLHNYLKATNHRLGFLVNFGHHPQIQIERIAR